MAHISKNTLRFMVSQVDWTGIMLELVDTQPETVANLLNDHFADDPEPKQPEPEQEFNNVNWPVADELSHKQMKGLEEAFSHVAMAVNYKDPQGRQTTSDKIRAIKVLRETFGINLYDAKQNVEKMMNNYERDPLYFPVVRRGGVTGYEFD